MDLRWNQIWHRWGILAQHTQKRPSLNTPDLLPTSAPMCYGCMWVLTVEPSQQFFVAASWSQVEIKLCERLPYKRRDRKPAVWRHKHSSQWVRLKGPNWAISPTSRESPYRLRGPETVYNLPNTMLLQQMKFNSCWGPFKLHSVCLCSPITSSGDLWLLNTKKRQQRSKGINQRVSLSYLADVCGIAHRVTSKQLGMLNKGKLYFFLSPGQMSTVIRPTRVSLWQADICLIYGSLILCVVTPKALFANFCVKMGIMNWDKWTYYCNPGCCCHHSD